MTTRTRQTELLRNAQILQNLLIAHATGSSADDGEYRNLRAEFLSDPTMKHLVPSFVQTCRDLPQFWAFIQGKFSTYAERRAYIWGEFSPIVGKLENPLVSPAGESASRAFNEYGAEHVVHVWQQALDRRQDDPEGAITSARTLLESVCKHILDDTGVACQNNPDLPKLYKLTARQLNLAPSQHTEQVFKQILGGCQTVVEGLGAVRNRLSDAHGKGRKPVKPASRHAELAVNLAGSMATFLIRTWADNQGKKT
jgi:hypothetical protein